MPNRVIRRLTFPAGQRMELVFGDLTQEPVEAIVNAANAHLLHGGGVAGIISRQGGPRVQAESNAWVRDHGPVPFDHPAYTTAGELPFRCIIHAVGPVWGEGEEERKLASSVQGALALADQLRLSSLALPAISTGIFGFPKEKAAPVLFQAIADYLDTRPASTLRQVRLTLVDMPTVEIFMNEWEGWEKRRMGK